MVFETKHVQRQTDGGTTRSFCALRAKNALHANMCDVYQASLNAFTSGKHSYPV